MIDFQLERELKKSEVWTEEQKKDAVRNALSTLTPFSRSLFQANAEKPFSSLYILKFRYDYMTYKNPSLLIATEEEIEQKNQSLQNDGSSVRFTLVEDVDFRLYL